jgi:hypothetical protein
MAKRGPKPGARWQWYIIRRERDGQYFTGTHQRAFLFGPRDQAVTFRLKPGFSTLCRIRRRFRERERKRPTHLPPETFVLEVQGNPKAKVNYPWDMPS